MLTTDQQTQSQTAQGPYPTKTFSYDERLSTLEMSQLWLLHQANSSAKYLLQYFETNTQDTEIKAIFNDSSHVIQLQLDSIYNIFDTVKFPTPMGFTDKDVKLNAKRLFSDSLMLVYYRMLTKFILIKLAHSIALVSRPDVREYINGNLNAALNMSNKIDDLLAKKGISIKPPYTPVPNMVDFIKSTDYFGSLFGKKRAINVLEATHIFDRLATKFSERAFVMAFAQVAHDKKVKQYFNKVVHVLDKEVDRWSALLNEENIRLPMSWRSDITDSTEPPFSDKLMLFQVVIDISFSVTANGFSLANCNRLDIVGNFEKTFLDLQLLGKDGLDLMIENKWMEEIPSVVDRQELIGLKH